MERTSTALRARIAKLEAKAASTTFAPEADAFRAKAAAIRASLLGDAANPTPGFDAAAVVPVPSRGSASGHRSTTTIMMRGPFPFGRHGATAPRSD